MASEAVSETFGADLFSDGDDFYGENPQAWSRLPKIMQAQAEGGYIDIDEPQMNYPNRLSTITEHTEKTEVQSMYTKPESTILGEPRSRYERTNDQRNSRSIQVSSNARSDQPIYRPEHDSSLSNFIRNPTTLLIRRPSVQPSIPLVQQRINTKAIPGIGPRHRGHSRHP